MFVLCMVAIFPSHNAKASTLSEILIKIEQLQNQVAELKAQLQSAVATSVSNATITYKETMFPRFVTSNITVLGTRNEDVVALQSFLTKQGYLSGSIDGVFGRQTEQGVKNFQTTNRLVVDGKVGTVTRTLINKKITEASYKIVADRPVDDSDDDLPGYPYKCDEGAGFVYWAEFEFEGGNPDSFVMVEAGLTITCVALAALSDIGNDPVGSSLSSYINAPKIDTLSSKGLSSSSVPKPRQSADYGCISASGLYTEISVDFGEGNPAPSSFTSLSPTGTWLCNKK